LTALLGIKKKLSTAHHPQTDGQTERANLDLENYLRRYVNWLQSDWSTWLATAEYAANSQASSATGVSPFYANYGYEPRMDFDVNPPPPAPSATARHAAQQAIALHDKMKEIWSGVKDSIKLSQGRAQAYQNQRRKDPEISPGDFVYISTDKLHRSRPTPKLDFKWTGPYPVKSVYEGAATLDLPPGSKIHPTINLARLRKYANDPLPGQPTDVESPDPVIPAEDPADEEYEVERILDARLNRRRKNLLEFRVKWRGWPDDPAWYSADNGEFSGSREALDTFYALPTTRTRRPLRS
jgi:hypothetical protein